MTIKPSELRKRLFSLIDHCLETGEEITVPRQGRGVKIVRATRRLAIRDLPERDDVLIDGGSLDTFSPSEWRPE